jgi:hypothetical protein
MAWSSYSLREEREIDVCGKNVRMGGSECRLYVL